ncbi:MAG TPA: hypothetical protein VIT92_03775 [Burkholderiaceae bacterium]
MSAREPLGRLVLRGSAPLLIWGVHFFVSYVAVAAACTRHAAGPGLRYALIAFSLVALGAVALLARRAWRHVRQQRLADYAVAAGATLAAIAIAWASVPLLLLDLCDG